MRTVSDVPIHTFVPLLMRTHFLGPVVHTFTIERFHCSWCTYMYKKHVHAHVYLRTFPKVGSGCVEAEEKVVVVLLGDVHAACPGLQHLLHLWVQMYKYKYKLTEFSPETKSESGIFACIKGALIIICDTSKGNSIKYMYYMFLSPPRRREGVYLPDRSWTPTTAVGKSPAGVRVAKYLWVYM